MCSNHIIPNLIKSYTLEKIAQSVRVLACHVKCCGFKSRFSRNMSNHMMPKFCAKIFI